MWDLKHLSVNLRPMKLGGLSILRDRTLGTKGVEFGNQLNIET